MPRVKASVIRQERFELRIERRQSVPLMRQAHRHDEVEVNYLEAGSVTYLIGGRLVAVPAGRFGFFWGAVPHQVMGVAAGSHGFWFVTIPLAWVLSWGLPPRLTGMLLGGSLLCDRAARPADAGRLVEWREAWQSDEPGRLKPLALELEARFRRFALDNASAGRPERPTDLGGVLGHVRALARFAVEHFQEPITLADVAAAAGLHPNYAANLFRRHCGQTLLQFLNQHRLAHAQRLLATTDRSITDVAMDSGFGSLSRFYEAFARATAMTPGAYRRKIPSPGMAGRELG